jgi:predicted RNA-binding Zn ribbon-like protein
MPRFFWVGNHPGLDFVNTEAADDRGQPLELLGSWDDVIAWADTAGLVERRAVAAARTPDHLKWARKLRSAARVALEADERQRAANTLADTVAQVPVRLACADPPVVAGDPADSIRLALALAVIDATTLDRSRVHRCAGERCVLLYYDTSKNRSRRWCDMSVCGNRSKAAAHYRRTRRT